MKVAPAVELMPKQRHSLPDVLAKAVGGGRSDSSKGAKDLEESHVCSLFNMLDRGANHPGVKTAQAKHKQNLK